MSTGDLLDEQEVESQETKKQWELLEEFNVTHIWSTLRKHRFDDVSLWLDIDEQMWRNMNLSDSDRIRFKKLQRHLEKQMQTIVDKLLEVIITFFNVVIWIKSIKWPVAILSLFPIAIIWYNKFIKLMIWLYNKLIIWLYGEEVQDVQLAQDLQLPQDAPSLSRLQSAPLSVSESSQNSTKPSQNSTNPSQNITKPKDENCPKRSLSSYFLYAAEVRVELRAEFPSLPMTQIAKNTGKKWKVLTEEEKKTYNEEAARLKVQYKVDLQKYQGSKSQQQFKKKLQEWKQECERRRQRAKGKIQMKKEAKQKKRQTKGTMEVSSDDSSDSDTDSLSSSSSGSSSTSSSSSSSINSMISGMKFMSIS